LANIDDRTILEINGCTVVMEGLDKGKEERKREVPDVKIH